MANLCFAQIRRFWKGMVINMQILKEDIRNKILQAALEEFYIKGYEKASLQEIAKRCAISKSNVYNYFPSKKSIYDSLTIPALNEIAKITKHLTKIKSNPDELDKIAKEFTESLKYVIYHYRREIVIVITYGSEQNGQTIMDSFKQELIQCFMQLDESLLPGDFLEVLSSMLIDGICKIIMRSQTEEEIEIQLYALFRYHVRGIQAFKG